MSLLKLNILFCLIFSMNTYAQSVGNGKKLYQKCIQCHGADGMGNQAEKAPRIAGQHDWYIKTQLNAFKNKKRHNPKMYPFIKDLTASDYEDLAAYVGQFKK